MSDIHTGSQAVAPVLQEIKHASDFGTISCAIDIKIVVQYKIDVLFRASRSQKPDARCSDSVEKTYGKQDRVSKWSGRFWSAVLVTHRTWSTRSLGYIYRYCRRLACTMGDTCSYRRTLKLVPPWTS